MHAHYERSFQSVIASQLSSSKPSLNLPIIIASRLHAGLEQLSRVDPRFLAYQRSLFSPTALSLDPSKLTAAELTNVHKSIRAFLTLLSPHFLSPGCFRTLEFLLRKYRQALLVPSALKRELLPGDKCNPTSAKIT
jgi:hypothetical protein